MPDTARVEGLRSEAVAPANGVRVLYIDDDPGLCRLVQRQLGRLGYHVDIATSGHEGLERITAGDVDVVALDHYMPGQDGLETLAAIRALGNPPPVVYVTGTQESRIAVAALKAGASDYVVKEVHGDFAELLSSAIDTALEQVKMRRAHEAAEAEIRAARDRFEALAAERALLLREMNHRVGNSLQIIMSLLHLQAGATENAEVQDALSNARGRVSAVAQVHRRLYTSDQVTTVAVDLYLGALLEDLQISAQHGEVGIELSLDIAALEIDPDRAVALGVIVTELVINASKYAYPGSKGPVHVRLAAQGERIELSVEDEGVGLIEGAAATSSGLGNRIVRAMASKLGAVMEFPQRPKGMAVKLTFPLATVASVGL